jgi:hypothetical protein
MRPGFEISSYLIEIETVGLAYTFDSCFPGTLFFPANHLEHYCFVNLSLSLLDFRLPGKWKIMIEEE